MAHMHIEHSAKSMNFVKTGVSDDVNFGQIK